MLTSWGFVKRCCAPGPARPAGQSHQARCFLEACEPRLLLSVSAVFYAQRGVLSVLGDGGNNTVEFSRNAAGGILVNGGAVRVVGGSPSVANTALIQAFGLGGHDVITLNEANGALPRANLFGGAGNDTLTGGASSDQLFGQAGNDTLLGRGGVDLLFGGSDADTLTGGDGDDLVFGESGNDRLIWNPGDDTDLNEGGGGIDTVEVNGGNGTEAFTLTANGVRARFDRLTPAPFSLDIGSAENLILNANGGDDTFSATGALAIALTIDGGPGNDTLNGSFAADVLIGGDGDDFIDGNQGSDLVFLGAGNDTFRWDAGDGSDTVEGQDGADTLLFNGSNGSEIIDISPNGARARLARNLGNIVMDLNGLETLDVNAFGAADTVTVGDLGGTDATEVNVSLLATGGGDAQADTVVVSGTGGADTVTVVAAGTSASVLGLPARVNVTGAEAASDRLAVNALGGNDTLDASTVPAGVLALSLDGGAGDDTILGSQGGDTLLGGEDDDFIDGTQGNDVAFLGGGNDTFQWDPGDGSDTVEGQDGADRLRFNGSNAAERFDVFANGGRVLLLRDVGNITMDMNDVESIDLSTFGGADAVTIGDLGGTDATAVSIALAAAGGDGQADSVVVSGTNGADVAAVLDAAGGVSVVGLPATVNVTAADAADDSLTINALGGDDTVDASGLSAGVIRLRLNGGLGDDVLIGSAGDDSAVGGDGNDLALLGAGDDTFEWNPGDDSDTVEGQDGFDTLRFNTANVGEVLDVAANGGRVRLFRNVANVVMDLDDVEALDLPVLGGADTVVVNDLTGTDVVEVNVILSATGGGGDAQPDSVIVNGTSTDDVVLVIGDALGVAVLGLAAQVNITGAEAANDRLTINTLAGDDTVEASGLAADGIALTADGGADNDVLIGGEGNDVLIGGDGDDVLLGGPGLDVLDGGTGDNIVIQG